MLAELLLHNGTIYPEATDLEQVQALAIGDGKVLAAGSASELETLSGPGTTRLDLGGRVVLPGLIDAHIHLEGLANSMAAIDCSTSSLEECLERIRQQAEKSDPGQWLTGHGWDQNIWGEWPTAQLLNQVAPENPVYLTARSLHAAVANRIALQAAGLNSRSPDPEDGQLQRTAAGKITGVLFEGAMRLISQQIPPPPIEQLAERIERAQEALWRVGIVGIHDFDGADCFSALQLLRNHDRLGLRVLKHIRSDYLEHALALGLRPGFGDDWLKIGNIKLFSDGALGPRTAAMIDAYDDDPGNRGILLLEEEEIVAIGLQAAAAGFTLAIHAIGDRANQVALGALERLNHELKGTEFKLSHRLEHLQLLKSENFNRVAAAGAIASMQPIHALSDQVMAERAWGERSRNSYAWRTMLNSGAILAFGSDAPVESPNPFWGLQAAISRRQPAPSELDPFVPEEIISLNEAMAAYTTGPSIAAGWSDRAGRLKDGFQADLIVLDLDPHKIEPEAIRQLKPTGVMVAGKWRIKHF